MIEYLNGRLDDLTPATATIDCHGVGYLANISVNTFSAIQGKETVRLYIYENIREDAYVLFGFATRQERELFLQLISVSGIGGNTARTILSAYTPAELADIITSGNEKMLKTVKGLGTKTAQRIIVELRDKLATLGITPASPANADDSQLSAASRQVYEDAVEALKALGYPPAPVSKTIKAILKDDPTATVEQVIKRSFKML
jgi:Holliday junction DNA helicase RuvA